MKDINNKKWIEKFKRRHKVLKEEDRKFYKILSEEYGISKALVGYYIKLDISKREWRTTPTQKEKNLLKRQEKEKQKKLKIKRWEQDLKNIFDKIPKDRKTQSVFQKVDFFETMKKLDYSCREISELTGYSYDYVVKITRKK